MSDNYNSIKLLVEFFKSSGAETLLQEITKYVRHHNCIKMKADSISNDGITNSTIAFETAVLSQAYSGLDANNRVEQRRLPANMQEWQHLKRLSPMIAEVYEPLIKQKEKYYLQTPAYADINHAKLQALNKHLNTFIDVLEWQHYQIFLGKWMSWKAKNRSKYTDDVELYGEKEIAFQTYLDYLNGYLYNLESHALQIKEDNSPNVEFDDNTPISKVN